MTYKRLAYTDHARDQMRNRQIRRGEVRDILATGDAVPPTVGTSGDVYHEKVRRIAGRNIGVVYLEDAHRILIITVEVFE